jgi:hypothetical protein
MPLSNKLNKESLSLADQKAKKDLMRRGSRENRTDLINRLKLPAGQENVAAFNQTKDSGSRQKSD